MIYRNVSCKRVIAKVFSDLALNEEDHRINDLIEWISEGLEKIGAFPSLITRVAGRSGEAPLELSDYQTRLPHAFHRLVQVAYSRGANGPWYPMRYATGSFDFGVLPKSNSTLDDPNAIIVGNNDVITLAMALYQIDYQDAIDKVNSDPAIAQQLQAMVKTSTVANINGGGEVPTRDYTFVIQGGFVKTNIKEGFLMMSYQAIPTDIDGYPLVPDDATFIEALYWYCVMKLYYPRWVQGTIRQDVYYHAQSSWNYHCKQAYGNALMPDTEQMESIKNSWVRLIPELNEHDTFFTTLGQQQVVYNAQKNNQ